MGYKWGKKYMIYILYIDDIFSEREMYDIGLSLVLVWVDCFIFGINGITIVLIKILTMRSITHSSQHAKSIYSTAHFI